MGEKGQIARKNRVKVNFILIVVMICFISKTGFNLSVKKGISFENKAFFEFLVCFFANKKGVLDKSTPSVFFRF